MKTTPRQRTILHVDLDPFFVSVERSLDPSLRGRPVIVGSGTGSSGIVAAVSHEARGMGVTPGQPRSVARRLCPEAAFLPGDLDAYARASEEVTRLLLAASRRVERPSADEAYVDLTPDSPGAPNPVTAAEAVKDDLQRRLGLDASLGLASSRIAARVASRWARPRGLLLVLPGYEESFLARQPLSALPDLPPHLETGLLKAGLETLGQVAHAAEVSLAAAVGPAAARRLREAARGWGEEPVALTAPPPWILEEATVRDRRADRAALEEILRELAGRACRRLKPFLLRAGSVAVEVRRAAGTLRRSQDLKPGLADEDTAGEVALALARPLLDPPAAVRGLAVRLGRLERLGSQSPLFPELSNAANH